MNLYKPRIPGQLYQICIKITIFNISRRDKNKERAKSQRLSSFFVLPWKDSNPSQAEPESDVLPLHHKAISICRKANLNLFLSFSATFVAWGCSCFAIAKLGRFYQFSKYFRIFFHFFLTGPCATFANGLYISKMKQYTHTKKCASASQHHISNLRNDKTI